MGVIIYSIPGIPLVDWQKSLIEAGCSIVYTPALGQRSLLAQLSSDRVGSIDSIVISSGHRKVGLEIEVCQNNAIRCLLIPGDRSMTLCVVSQIKSAGGTPEGDRDYIRGYNVEIGITEDVAARLEELRSKGGWRETWVSANQPMVKKAFREMRRGGSISGMALWSGPTIDGRCFVCCKAEQF